MGIPNLPVTINQKHVGYAINGNYPNPNYREGHIFDKEEYKKLPDKIADPVAVIRDPSSSKEIIIYAEMKNNTGEPVIVPFRMGTTSTVGGKRILANRLTTVFADNDGLNVLESAISRNTKENPTVYYLNKEKALKYPLKDDTITIVRGGISRPNINLSENIDIVKESNKYKNAQEILNNWEEAQKMIQQALDNPKASFSLAEPIEATTSGLVAVHNLREN